MRENVNPEPGRPLTQPRQAANLRRLRWPGRTRFRSYHRRVRDLESEGPLDSSMLLVEADNPFERLAAPRPHERLVAALHIPGLTDLSPDEAFVISQIAEQPDDWGVRPFAVGAAAPVWRGLPVMQFDGDSTAPWSESARIQWDATTKSVSGLALFESTREILRRSLSERDMVAAHDVLAAHEAGARFVVTKDRHLLECRDLVPLLDVNLLTPLEAGVVMGVWSRATDRNGLFSHWAAGDFMYYWALARALTPAGWPAFAALVHGSRVFPNGDRLEALAQSILTRLDYLVEALDDLFVLWQREATNPVTEDVGNLLDGILLRGWAVQDNIAVLTSKWFGIATDDPRLISLHDRRWRKAVRDVSPRAAAVLDAIQPTARLLRASQTLRDHAVHREVLRTMRLRREDGDERATFLLPSVLGGELRTGLTSAGERPQDWGLAEEIQPHTVHNTIDHGGGYVEEFEGPSLSGAFLDPMAFAARFVASTAKLANAAFAAIAPESDPRLPEPLRARSLRLDREPWASAEVGWQLVLTSPLSALVPWASPDAGTASRRIDAGSARGPR